jgi:hypothetical protein
MGPTMSVVLAPLFHVIRICLVLLVWVLAGDLAVPPPLSVPVALSVAVQSRVRGAIAPAPLC